MHLKRSNIKGFWPIPKKGTKYVALPVHNKKDSMPLIILMRDVLKIVRNKKELKRILNEKQIKINGREVREANFPLSLFDVVSLEKINKNYRILLSEQKKFVFKEVKGREAEAKIYKVLNKKILPGKIIQFNLMNGKNIISKEKVKIGDSVAINFKDNKIEKVISMEKGRKIFIIRGKHAGIYGKIEEIVESGGKTIAKINSNKKRMNVWVKNIIALE